MQEEAGSSNLPRFLKIWIGLEVARYVAGLLLYPQPIRWEKAIFDVVISVLLVVGMSRHSRGARAIALFFAGMAAFFGFTQLPQYPLGSQESWWRLSTAALAGVQIVVLLLKGSKDWFEAPPPELDEDGEPPTPVDRALPGVLAGAGVVGAFLLREPLYEVLTGGGELNVWGRSAISLWSLLSLASLVIVVRFRKKDPTFRGAYSESVRIVSLLLCAVVAAVWFMNIVTPTSSISSGWRPAPKNQHCFRTSDGVHCRWDR